MPKCLSGLCFLDLLVLMNENDDASLNLVLTLNFCKFMTLNLTIHDTNFKIILKNVSDMTKYKF